MIHRRSFIKGMAFSTLAVGNGDFLLLKKQKIKVGLVTYQWAKDWDLPAIIQNCKKSGIKGVELRTEHKHGVEPSLSAGQRKEVKQQFTDSGITLLGYGSNTQFDDPDPAVVRKNIDQAKVLLQLSHDIGGSGVKVKPNSFHEGVPHGQTLEQIGRSLNELGSFADGLGQQVRLEVHGRETQELPNIKSILDVAVHPRVAICWNCNPEDVNGKGLDYNFNLVKDRLGDTVHIHEMNNLGYPCADFIQLLKKNDYSGWLLLECSSEPQDKVAAMTEQRNLWEKLIAG
ncbi:MAG: sugar phosphate isomerase/epimerase family protein [Flavitalea sp.]